MIYNQSVNSDYRKLINLQEALANETHRAKLPYISSDMQVILDIIASTPKPVAVHDFKIWSDHPISYTTTAMLGALILTLIVLIFCIY